MLWWPVARPRSGGAIWDHLVNTLSAIAQDCLSQQVPCAQDEGQEEPLSGVIPAAKGQLHHPSLQKSMIWCSPTCPQAPFCPQGESDEYRTPWSHVFEAICTSCMSPVAKFHKQLHPDS